MDIIDRMEEHVSAIDHLTNTAPNALGCCLHMLERELRTTASMLIDFREECIEDEIDQDNPTAEEIEEEITGFHFDPGIQPRSSVREMILKAASAAR